MYAKYLICPILCLLFFFCVIGWGIARFTNYINFEIHCGGHLKRAADANTVDLALQELKTATTYTEQNNLTKGSTHLLFPTPDKDVGFWYKNLKASEKELELISPQTTQLEKTNLLMKLRETLLDQGEKGTSVTAPQGISIFPDNWPYAIWGWVSIILCGFFMGLGVYCHLYMVVQSDWFK